MRSSNLVFCAVGSAAALASVYATSQFGDQPQKQPIAFRTVFAPDLIPLEGASRESDNIAFAAGEVIRECGVTEFKVNLGDLHGLTYDIEITETNVGSLHCIEEEIRSVDEGIKLGFKVI